MIDAIDVWMGLGITGWLSTFYLLFRLAAARDEISGLERLIETMNFIRYTGAKK